MLSLYDGAVSEAQFLHGREAGNCQPTSDALFFSIFRKTPGRPVQNSYRMSSLESVASSIIGAEDTYISQSAFWGANRRAVNFQQTRAAWVDLDLYNIDKKVDVATVTQILRHAEALGIPTPTSVIASGRGCYLKWIFRTPVTQHQLPVWQTLQAVLTAAFSCLAADENARDASRVLRLLETRNSKGGGLVELIDGCGELYDFQDMCCSVESLRLDLLVETQAKKSVSMVRKLAKRSTALSEKMLHASERGDVDALNLFAELHQPIMLGKLNVRSLNWARFCDLKNLYNQRGGIPVGQRDTAMFWMLNFLSHASVIHASNWNSEIAELQQAFPAPASFKPSEDGSMSTLLKRVQHKEGGIKYKWNGEFVSPMYRPSNQFLIQAFAIAPNEMKPLSTIISAEEKRARLDDKVVGRSVRREARSQWREAVLDAFTGQQAWRRTARTAPALPVNAASLAGVASSASSTDTVTNKDDGHVNLSALAIYLGVERTRLTRYWNGLKREHLRVSGADVEIRVATPATEALAVLPLPQPQHEIQTLTTTISPTTIVISPLESARLAKLATFKAIEAKQAQACLLFERRKLSMQDAWARRKLSGLINPANTSIEDTKDTTMVATKSQALIKKMALLQAALAVGSGHLPDASARSDAVIAPSVLNQAFQQDSEPIAAMVFTLNPADAVPFMPSQPEPHAAAVQTSVAAPAAASQAYRTPLNQDSDFEGYGAFFEAPQDYQWIADSLPPAEVVAIKRFENVAVLAAPVLDAPAKVAAALPQSVCDAAAPLTASDRLRLAMRPTQPAKRQVPASARPTVSYVPAIPANHLSAPVEASTSGLRVTASMSEAGSRHGPMPLAPVAPILVNALPAKPLSATERLRMVSERVAKLPPMQRESKANVERIPLIEGAVGAPRSYPGEDLWPSQTIPPGSNYTEVEWEIARGGGGKEQFDVIEVQSSQRSFLMQLAIPELIITRQMVNGVMVTQTQEVPDVSDALVKYPAINALLRQVYSNCLLVASDSFPMFVGATEADFILNFARYRVIRPRLDYLDPERAFRVGAVMEVNIKEAAGKPVSEIRSEAPTILENTLQDYNVSDDSEKEPNFSPVF